jgi:putative toxin-antitoxin system antitoxin component (TIGR02293 family)
VAVVTACRLIESGAVLRAIGIGERALRRAQEESKRLDANVSDRVLRLAAVTLKAIDVLGSQETAERWLSIPAMGLDSRKPIDLLQTTGGTEGQSSSRRC